MFVAGSLYRLVTCSGTNFKVQIQDAVIDLEKILKVFRLTKDYTSLRRNNENKEFLYFVLYHYPYREGVGTSNFRTTTGLKFQNIEGVFLVHHYYYIRTSKVSF